MPEAVKDIINTVYKTNSIDFKSIQKVTTVFSGLLTPYIVLIIMALLPIYIGSFRSVPLQVENKIKKNMIWTITEKYSLLPFILGGLLLILNYIFEDFPMEHCINLAIILLPNIFGVVTFSYLMRNQFSAWLPNIIPKTKYQLQFTKDNGVQKLYWINVEFTMHDVITFNLCIALGIFNLYSKHWISNNILMLAIAIYLVTLLHINKMTYGFIILCTIFVLHVYPVFFTNSTGSVCKSFDAPSQIIFPLDLLENDILASTNFCILGLDLIDIVGPGIFIAFLLRFDHSLKLKTNFYFNVTFLAYFLGLLLKIFVDHIFEVILPLSLYLIPACLITPITTALIFGDLKSLLSYKDYEDVKMMKSKNSSKKSV